MTGVFARLPGGRRALGIIGNFAFGQGTLQCIQIVAGLLLVRWLSVDAWAQFGLASGLQITMGTLMDLGISGTIIPLVGGRRDNLDLVGRYVRSARHFRNWTFWILSPITVVAFMAMAHQHHWGWHLPILLLASVLLTLYSSGQMSCFSAPLLLFGRLRDYYTPQSVSGLVRLAAFVVCFFAGLLNAWTAAAITALSFSLSARLLERKSRRYLKWPKVGDPSIDRELIQYVLPATPAIVFAAFQSQIALFLIGLFGRTANIAEVAALGRIGQLFAVFMTFNVVVIEPYVARLSRERLLRTYLGFLALNALLGIPVVLLAFAFPESFLWVLGKSYAGLGNSVGWVVLAGCINQIAGLMWIMNRSRKWLFWSGTILEITLLLIVQVTYIVLVGVRTTQQAVLFTFVSSFCYIIAHGYVGIYGFLKGPDKAASSGALNEI
jgi:O-antigen/teichoic acid export membrane protein